MRLTLHHIGKIEMASIEINGITVIAGENNTGKSTVSRALFAMFNSFSNIQKQVEDERTKCIENVLYQISENIGISFPRLISIAEIARTVVSHVDTYRHLAFSDLQRNILSLLLQDVDDAENKMIDRKMITEFISQIKEILDITDIDYLSMMLRQRLNAEFNGQICNIYSEENGEIQFQVRDKKTTVLVDSGGNVRIQNQNDISLQTEAVYLDDPFVLDEQTMFFYHDAGNALDHKQHLQRKLFAKDKSINVFDEIIVQGKLGQIFDKLSSVCDGDIVHKKHEETGYRKKNSDKVLNVRNLSTGLKTFVILKILLINGTIRHNGTVILDEPEIHLHPEWQLVFAELIVLIQKEFGIHVLLNTHSPYFLNAIEVYAVKYKIDDKCKYYLASASHDVSNIVDVSDHIDAIYAELARPLQDLENERGKL